MTEQDPTGRSAHEPGAKLDAGKPRPALVLGGFSRALEAVTEVGTFGARKYTPNGWRSVPNGVERYSEAMLRHWLKETQGIELDPGSNLTHAAHLAWNALARLELMLEQQERQRMILTHPHRTGSPIRDRAILDTLQLLELGCVPGWVDRRWLEELWNEKQFNVSRRLIAVRELGIIKPMAEWGRYYVIRANNQEDFKLYLAALLERRENRRRTRREQRRNQQRQRERWESLRARAGPIENSPLNNA